ncbi:aminotransferase class III-fold pyridoxal phosphate-dependent enzyme [Rhodococcus hoagii]|nr:aminotransferase class III-fold pyridoxal phosphate-dependent enzyme [Prescottella equi]
MPDIEYRLPQQLRLGTELPGPRSLALAARRRAAVGACVGSSVPVYAVDADGGVIVDVDGNSLIDFGSGIAVTGAGASNTRSPRPSGQGGAVHPHVLHVTPYEEYVAVCERLVALTPATTTSERCCSIPADAVENAVKIARHRPAATPSSPSIRVPRPHHLTMALTAKNLPYKDGFGTFVPECTGCRGRIRSGSRRIRTAARSPANRQQDAHRPDGQQIGARRIAAIVLEPIQARAGSSCGNGLRADAGDVGT